MQAQTPRPSPAVRGLYAVTPDLADTLSLCKLVEASIKGGAAVIQYRNKTAGSSLRKEQAASLLGLCRRYAAPLIINDHLDLCLEIDADGVHLGGEDGDIAAARQALGNKLLGISCYNRFELALAAKKQGADYVAFGSCFDSATKPAAGRAPLTLIAQAGRELDLPIVAIGGITLANAGLAIDAGADSIAVIGALFMADDVQQTAAQFSNLFKKRNSP